MSFDSLDRILEALAKQPGWQVQQQFRLLLQCWETVVSDQIAQQTRPLYISRHVLWVATSSSVWAQNLSLQRYSLLQKLNKLLTEPLVDIRFSTAQWFNSKRLATSESQLSQLEKHPSTFETNAALALPELSPEKTTPETAFQRWAAIIAARSQNLSLCPRCQCPTPPGELERWAVCAYCAAKQWSSEQQTNFDPNLS
jgi:predicted nucleic acid-binding Zn ribbon protein